MKKVKHIVSLIFQSFVPLIFIISAAIPLVPLIWNELIAEGIAASTILSASLALAINAVGLCSVIAAQIRKIGEPARSLLMKTSIALPVLANVLTIFAALVFIKTDGTDLPIAIFCSAVLIVSIIVGIAKTLQETDDSRPFKRCIGLIFAFFVAGNSFCELILRNFRLIFAGMFILARYAVK